MLTRDERLRYLAKIEQAQATLLSDPEVAAEYAQASSAWDSTIRPAILDDATSEPSVGQRQTEVRSRS